MRPLRNVLLCAILASSIAVVGCFKFDFSNGSCGLFAEPCSSGSGSSPISTDYILGFDPSTVDRTALLPQGGYRVLLRVGDTVTLHLVSLSAGDFAHPRDTVHLVNWGITDSSSVSSALEDFGGGLRLIGKQAGRAGSIRANGSYPAMWACAKDTSGPNACTYISAIDVVPR